MIDLLHRDADKSRFLSFLARVKELPGNSAGKNDLLRSAEQALDIKERSQQHQQRERGLLAVLETAQDLTAIMDLDRVLQAIVQRARKLVGCDVGYLSIFDPSHGDFYVRATDGAFSEKFKQIRVGLEVGVCGFVARNKSPYSSSDYGADSRFAHTALIDSAMVDENIKSILGVPLLAGEQVIGVLFVGDRYVRSYVAWEKSILSTLAAHASVAIGNARLFEQEQAALKQASETNLLLTRQTAATRVAAEAHERLTTLVAKGGGLPDICDMVASMLGGSVVVYDDGEQQVCCSDGDGAASGRQRNGSGSDGYWLADKIHFALNESRIQGRSVLAFDEPGRLCRVSAVIGGRGMLGGLAIYTAAPLREMEVRIFERSSIVAGVVLLSQERRESANLVQMSGLVRGLVGSPQDSLPLSAARAARYGLDLSRPVHLAVLETPADKAAYILRRLQGKKELADMVFGELGDSLVFLCNQKSAPQLLRVLPSLVAGPLRQGMTGVVSDPVPASSDLPRAYERLGHCLAFLRVLERTGKLFQERELSLYSALFRSHDAHAIQAYLASSLGPLYPDRDARRAELARTLLTYLDCGHNARMAAGLLDVHVNTIRQRLDAIDLLLGDWNTPARILDLHVALRLWHLGGDRKAAWPESVQS